jgi:hypothetical protein
MKAGHSNLECVVSPSEQMECPWHPHRRISVKRWAVVRGQRIGVCAH